MLPYDSFRGVDVQEHFVVGQQFQNRLVQGRRQEKLRGEELLVEGLVQPGEGTVSLPQQLSGVGRRNELGLHEGVQQPEDEKLILGHEARAVEPGEHGGDDF